MNIHTATGNDSLAAVLSWLSVLLLVLRKHPCGRGLVFRTPATRSPHAQSRPTCAVHDGIAR